MRGVLGVADDNNGRGGRDLTCVIFGTQAVQSNHADDLRRCGHQSDAHQAAYCKFHAPFDLHVPENQDGGQGAEEVGEDIHDALSITKSSQLAFVKALARYFWVPEFLKRSELRGYGAHCDHVDNRHGEHDEVDQIRCLFAIRDSQDEQQNRQFDQVDADHIVHLICSVPLDNVWDLSHKVLKIASMLSSSAVDTESVEHCTHNRECLMPTRLTVELVNSGRLSYQGYSHEAIVPRKIANDPDANIKRQNHVKRRHYGGRNGHTEDGGAVVFIVFAYSGMG